MEYEEVTMAFSHRLSHFVWWLTFAIFNLSLIVLFLLVAWLFELKPAAVIALLDSTAQSFHLQSTWPVVAFFGVSGGTLLAGYAWLWQKGYKFLILPYLWKTIEARVAKEKESLTLRSSGTAQKRAAP